MEPIGPDPHRIDRRNFLRSAGAGLAAAGAVLTGNEHGLDQLANKLAVTGTRLQHVSNNAPTNLASADPDLRLSG